MIISGKVIISLRIPPMTEVKDEELLAEDEFELVEEGSP